LLLSILLLLLLQCHNLVHEVSRTAGAATVACSRPDSWAAACLDKVLLLTQRPARLAQQHAQPIVLAANTVPVTTVVLGLLSRATACCLPHKVSS
jgi:hypothetical protein